ncbi:MAG: maleylacetate reductase [Gammaproteobacteria bacterium]|nr:maleylacetate reductase [Gammaproteobacteria bacterium]
MTHLGRFTPPPRQVVLYGVPVAEALDQELNRLGAARIVFVTNSSLAQSGGLADTVTAALGTRAVSRVIGIGAHSPRRDVIRIADALREHRADAVVGFGGGSVCDATKVAGLALANAVSTLDGITSLRAPAPHTKAPVVPFVAIPTTLSAGEFTCYAGVTDERIQRKELFWHAAAAPDIVILDAAMTVATPARLWFGTGIRALDHAVETWCSINVSPMVEATSLHALRLLVPALRACQQDESALAPRLEALIGAWLSIQGVATGVDLGASHGIGHMLGGTAGMPHGETSCVMLPHVLRYNSAVNAERQASLAAAMGSPEIAAADILQALVASLGLPGRLRDANVPRDLLPRIADESMRDMWIPTNPRPLTESAQVLALLEAAW